MLSMRCVARKYTVRINRSSTIPYMKLSTMSVVMFAGSILVSGIGLSGCDVALYKCPGM